MRQLPAGLHANGRGESMAKTGADEQKKPRRKPRARGKDAERGDQRTIRKGDREIAVGPAGPTRKRLDMPEGEKETKGIFHRGRGNARTKEGRAGASGESREQGRTAYRSEG